MKYKVILNNEDITKYVNLGVNIKERLAEELDVGGLTINYWNSRESIPMLSRLKLQELENNGYIKNEYDMLVVNDNVTPMSQSMNTRYLHEVDLIELTHKLDYYIINALAFTQPIVEPRVAPFEHYYRVQSGDFDTEGNGLTDGSNKSAVSLEFPELYKPMEFHKDERLEIPPIDYAIMWAPDENGEIYKYSEVPIILRLYKINRKVLPNTEIEYESEFVSEHDTGSTTVLNLEHGYYKLEYSVFTQVSPYGERQEPFLVTRRFSYQFQVIGEDRYSLYDVINRIRSVTPIEKKNKHEETRIFNIPTKVKEKLKKIKAPQLYFSRLTSREAINNTLKYINTISRLVSNGEYDDLTLTDFNKRTNKFIHDMGDTFVNYSSQSAKEYTSANKGFLSNTINTNSFDNPSVNELGSGLFKGLRSEEFQALPQNGVLRTQYNIFRLLSLEVKLNIKRVFTNIADSIGTTSNTYHHETVLVNLLPYVKEQGVVDLARVTKDVFGLLGSERYRKLTGEFFRDVRSTLASYRYGDNKIDFTGEVGMFFPETKIERILDRALSEHLSYKIGERYKLENGTYPSLEFAGKNAIYKENSFNDYIYCDSNGNSLRRNNNDFMKELAFRVSYIAIEDNVQESHKEDTSIIDKYTEAVNQNNDKLVNFERATVGNYGIAQRLGVPTISYGKMTRGDKQEEIGYYNENREVVVEKEKVFYQDHILESYEASKDFSRLAKYIGVDREYRPYENPTLSNAINRNDNYTEYLEYSTTDIRGEVPEPNDTYINDSALETILNTLTRKPFYKKDYVKLAIMKTDGFEEEYPSEKVEILPANNTNYALLVPVISQGGKNTLSFKFGFKSNVTAGDSLVENYNGVDSIDDVLNIIKEFSDIRTYFSNEDVINPYGVWRRYIPYGNMNGRFNLLKFNLLTNFSVEPTWGDDGYFEETKDYPLIKSTSNSTTEHFFENQNENTVLRTDEGNSYENSLVINKDPGEIYSMTYQLSLVPKDKKAYEDVVFGEMFSSRNLMVSPYTEEPLYLYLYDDGGEQLKLSNKVRDGWFNKIEISDEVYIRKDNTLRTVGIGILDETLRDSTSWSIGDEDGNLYLANNTNNPYINIAPRNKRSSINYKW